jgi:hypothetical protein
MHQNEGNIFLFRHVQSILFNIISFLYMCSSFILFWFTIDINKFLAKKNCLAEKLASIKSFNQKQDG